MSPIPDMTRIRRFLKQRARRSTHDERSIWAGREMAPQPKKIIPLRGILGSQFKPMGSDSES